MDRREYWQKVKDTAADVYRDWVDDLKRDPDQRYPEDLLSDLFHTHADADLPDCNAVMEHSDNEDAASDMGVEPSGKWRDILQQFCFYAYYQDVQDSFSNTYDTDETIKEIREAAGLDQDEDEDAPDSSPPQPRRFLTKDAFKIGDDDDFDGVAVRRPRLLDLFRRRR